MAGGTGGGDGRTRGSLTDLDAALQETWPAGANAEVAVLVRVAAAQAEEVSAVLGGDVARFGDEESAQRAAAELAATSS